jgi:uncharacterized protein (TIRG00374 family)
VFTASQLVGRIPLLPGGLGQIETGLVVGLRATGMPVADALAATLIFRIASQWLIVPLGWPVWWWRRRTHADDRPGRDQPEPAEPAALTTAGR